MDGTSPEGSGRFYKFGLIVTGKGEEQFLPKFLRSLADAGNCTFEVITRVEQRSPITAEKKKLKMVGTNKPMLPKDVEQIGLPARNYLKRSPNNFAILVDDLEHARRERHRETFERYRAALDEALTEDSRHRVSVHFLVNMVEAYYFGDVDAVNEVLGTSLASIDGDVEEIRHPKGDLKHAKPGFDEVEDGFEIVKRLNLDRVLSDPSTCASLRTLFKWCWRIIKQGGVTDRFQLRRGVCCPVTGQQLDGPDLVEYPCSGE
jgi:hypothetical protein